MVEKNFNLMTGYEFEKFLAELFNHLGYDVSLTPKSHDYGADLLLSLHGQKIVVQAKNYSRTVGVSAVQEIIGAMSYYKASSGIVVASSSFTVNACQLAQTANIELWDNAVLREKVFIAFNSEAPAEVSPLDFLKKHNINHLLIYGPTGIGKSFYIHYLLYDIIKMPPKDNKLLLIDPKAVEFGMYNGVPHLEVSVISDPQKATGSLCWAVSEMLNRYKIFAANNVRDIQSYNQLAGEVSSITPTSRYYIIIDEISELYTAECLEAIQKILSLGSQAGIHLILATNNPSVFRKASVNFSDTASFISTDKRSLSFDHFSGNTSTKRYYQIPEFDLELVKTKINELKSENPANYNEAVVSKFDRSVCSEKCNPLFIKAVECVVKNGYASAILLQRKLYIDYSTAEDLIDMMEDQKIIGPFINSRIRTVLISESELKNIRIKHSLKEDDFEDEMLSKAIECVVDAGIASTTLLQRKLRLGYVRAARLIDELESRGIVGPFDGSKPRAVLMTKVQWLEIQAKAASENMEAKIDDYTTVNYDVSIEHCHNPSIDDIIKSAAKNVDGESPERCENFDTENDKFSTVNVEPFNLTMPNESNSRKLPLWLKLFIWAVPISFIAILVFLFLHGDLPL